MKSLVEQEAIRFHKDLYRQVKEIKYFKEAIEIKLFDFKRNRDKFIFLKSIRIEIDKERIKHRLTCKKFNCQTEKGYNVGYFVIDQELESINEVTDNTKDAFTLKEESDLNETINSILTKLNKMDDKLTSMDEANFEIYEEVIELKFHYSLGKKNFYQLAKGKVFDIVFNKGMESDLAEATFKELFKGVNNFFIALD